MQAADVMSGQALEPTAAQQQGAVHCGWWCAQQCKHVCEDFVIQLHT